MGLLSGLSGLGLGGLDKKSLYEDNKPAETKAPVAEEKPQPAEPQVKESDYLFEKSYTCPVCDRNFKALTMKANRAKLRGTDIDLRPTYDNVEPLKYDVVMCPRCGCASVGRYWTGLTPNQRKLIKEEITSNFVPKEYTGDTYTFDEALERYQVALANAMVKQAKASEKAYICLRAGWTLRSKYESMDPADPKYEAESERVKTMENDFLESALEGFVTARSSEMPPVCGMDEMTLDYLIAALSVRFGQYDQAAKLVGSLLTNRNLNPRMKEKALNLKDMIVSAKSGK